MCGLPLCQPGHHLGAPAVRRLDLKVDPRDAGERLDRFIAARGGISRGLSRRTLEAGGVFVDGRRCKIAGRLLRTGQDVVVNLEEGGRESAPSGPLDPSRLLHVDDEIVVVDKPAFVPAQATLTSDRGALPELVAKLLGEPVTLVHRLDRETSGATVFARSARATAVLSDAFRRGDPDKTYLALTVRSPTPPTGRIEAPLLANPDRRGTRIVNDCGDPATTRYETLGTGPTGSALVECHPETGRTHQIRTHLAHLGAPILGDWRYGGPRRVGDAPMVRVMLHARRLEISHPADGRRLVFEAPLPEDFALALRTLVPSRSAVP